MKLAILLLCVFAVTSYGATSGLKFKLHNNVVQSGEEEALLTPTEEPVYSVGEPLPEEAAPAEEGPAKEPLEPAQEEAAPAEEGPAKEPLEEPVYSVGEPLSQEAPAETGEESLYPAEEPVYSVGEPLYQEALPEEPVPAAAPEETGEEGPFEIPEPSALTIVQEAPLAPEPEPLILPGGYSNVDLSRLEQDEQLRAALDLGVDTLLQTAREDGKIPRGENGYKLKTVTEIQQQVVAGINYKFNAVLENAGDGRIYAEFTVYRGLDSSLTVKEGCLRVGRVVRI